jgi:hypothetical protein
VCLHFDGNDIIRALRKRKPLEKHDLSGVINDSFDDNVTGIYRVIAQDHKGPREYLFYFRHTNAVNRTYLARFRRKAISQLAAKCKGTKRTNDKSPLITRQAKRLKLQDRSTSTELPPLQRPPSGSPSWIKERRTYHATVTKKLHQSQKWSFKEGSTAKVMLDSLHTQTLVKQASSNINNDIKPQKLSFSFEADNPTHFLRERIYFYIYRKEYKYLMMH